MAESLLDFIHENFPQAENNCFRRTFGRGHTIFFDKKSGKKLLPEFTEPEVFASLFLCKYYANQADSEFILTGAEEELFERYKILPKKRQ